MKIIHEGKAHKTMAWFHTCPNCDSQLRVIEGDPQASRLYYNCDRRQYWIRYICPICGARNIAMTSSAFGTPKANAEYRSIVLTEEDRKEIDGYETKVPDLSEEDKKFLENWMAP